MQPLRTALHEAGTIRAALQARAPETEAQTESVLPLRGQSAGPHAKEAHGGSPRGAEAPV